MKKFFPLLNRKARRAEWLHDLTALTTQAVIDDDLHPIKLFDTLEKLSLYFSQDQDVADQVSIALGAIAGTDLTRAQQLTYGAAIKSTPGTILDQRLAAQWEDLSRESLDDDALYSVFLHAACNAPKGTALKTRGLMGMESSFPPLFKKPADRSFAPMRFVCRLRQPGGGEGPDCARC